jgi:hypothetical protein
MENWKIGKLENWNVEALAEIPLRREKDGMLRHCPKSLLGRRRWNPYYY